VREGIDDGSIRLGRIRFATTNPAFQKGR